MSFNPALPQPYKEKWREAYRYDKDDLPRLATYQASGGPPSVPFIFDSIRFSGGQSVDTAEYPFDGLWSNTRLNEKPQAITVHGFIRGESYISQRNFLIEALRVPTSDEEPGYIELPLWGRFPVVVITYEVEEAGKQNGQCSVSMTFTRAGVTIEDRLQAEEVVSGITGQAAEELEAAAIDEFSLLDFDPAALTAGFSGVKDRLLGILGRVQAAGNTLEKITGSITDITTLIAQGIRSPLTLASAAFAAAGGIVAGVLGLKNSTFGTISGLRNMANILTQFLSSGKLSVYNSPASPGGGGEEPGGSGSAAASIKQAATQRAVDNLFKTMSLCAAAQLIVEIEDVTHEQAQGYWTLLETLRDSIDQESPAVYQAVRNLRIAASRELSARDIAAEKTRRIGLPVPLLYLAHYLGCKDDLLRRLNPVADSFVLEGDVRYV